MKDCYGAEQKYLIKPVKVDYSISQSTPEKTINEGIFYTFHITDENCFESGFKIQLNLNDAIKLAENNGLKLITEDQSLHILEKVTKYF